MTIGGRQEVVTARMSSFGQRPLCPVCADPATHLSFGRGEHPRGQFLIGFLGVGARCVT